MARPIPPGGPRPPNTGNLDVLEGSVAAKVNKQKKAVRVGPFKMPVPKVPKGGTDEQRNAPKRPTLGGTPRLPSGRVFTQPVDEMKKGIIGR